MSVPDEIRPGGARLFAIEDALDSDAWYTPAWVFDGMGVTFDVDVASPDGGLPWLPARRFYTVADDGLSMPWDGWVWCNPPYSDPGPWCRKWAAHEPGGCLLIRSDLSTEAGSTAFSAATSIYAHPKRINFVNGAGRSVFRQGLVSFSTVILGRGAEMDAALGRLAHTFGGSARALRKCERPFPWCPRCGRTTSEQTTCGRWADDVCLPCQKDMGLGELASEGGHS